MRAREWASRRLDGELSEFEGVLLEAHLACCEACRAFDAGARASTEALRGAPFVPMHWPVNVSRRRRRPSRSRLALGVAGVGTLAVSLSFVSALPSHKPSSRVHALELTAHQPREEPNLESKPCALKLRRDVPRHVVAQYCG